MTQYVAIAEVHLLDAKTKKPIIVNPGDKVTIEDEVEAKRLLSLGAIAKPKDKHVPPKEFVAASAPAAEDETDGEGEGSEDGKPKKGKKGKDLL